MVTLSDLASRKLSEILAKQEEKVYALRLHAMAGCCSGPSYGMSLAGEAMPGDWEGEIGGVRFVVDPESAGLIEGATIDFVETEDQAGFTIQNPRMIRVGGGCGCHGEAETAEAETGHGHGGSCGCGGH